MGSYSSDYLLNNLKIVKKPTLVTPAKETQNGHYFLSNLDLIVPVTFSTVYYFKEAAPSFVESIKDSLADILVYYHPFAGRLLINEDGKLVINCTGEGAVFVEAEVDCYMDEIGDFESSDPKTLPKLVYDRSIDAKNMLEVPPLAVQVTRFNCGEFILGVSVNHCIVDGLSLVEFLNSWGELARGLPLTIPPFLDRTVLIARNPTKVEFTHDEYTEIEDISKNTTNLVQEEDLVFKSFVFDSMKLKQLKTKAMEDGILQTCSTFEALTAFMWRARSRALKLLPDQITKLYFAVDGRDRFVPPLPEGYFGNGAMFMSTLCSSGELLGNPMSYSVQLIRNSIKSVTDSYIRSSIDCYEETRTRASLSATFLVSTWSKLSFHTIDFGCGVPVSFGPVPFPGLDLFLPYGDDRKGINVFIGLPSSAMKLFEKLMEISIQSID
ncbi:omega-hydroxypalmitate O-feruloyl transferase-like [Papaver somniferum]|uniref:omega-hydroxypalmitate O-feruloyl transferase-like n=1 Tax=Papaver somniferum TaxID=3469 RepID=UPI000E6FD609|nr:omega-hydroxypalmitate O-feruloyl transferase-like [Papaver somniferum]